MKDIGITPEGNRLVEMSEDEHREFSRLRTSIEGKTSDTLVFVQDHRLRDDFDFSYTFHVIRAYYLNRFAVNNLRRLLDDIEDALKKG